MTPAVSRFVLHWGEMGTRWGINRSVAQIHALLYLSERPLHAEEICALLGLARSNVSTSLRELQGWRIVRVVHVMGDRRDHFETLADPWEMFRLVLEERKRREIDPTLAVLDECVESAARERATEHVQARLERLSRFFREMDGWYRQMTALPLDEARRLVRMGNRVRKLLGGGR